MCLYLWCFVVFYGLLHSCHKVDSNLYVTVLLLMHGFIVLVVNDAFKQEHVTRPLPDDIVVTFVHVYSFQSRLSLAALLRFL